MVILLGVFHKNFIFVFLNFIQFILIKLYYLNFKIYPLNSRNIKVYQISFRKLSKSKYSSIKSFNKKCQIIDSDFNIMTYLLN